MDDPVRVWPVDQINTKTAVTRSENGNDGRRNGRAGWVEAGAE